MTCLKCLSKRRKQHANRKSRKLKQMTELQGQNEAMQACIDGRSVEVQRLKLVFALLQEPEAINIEDQHLKHLCAQPSDIATINQLLRTPLLTEPLDTLPYLHGGIASRLHSTQPPHAVKISLINPRSSKGRTPSANQKTLRDRRHALPTRFKASEAAVQMTKMTPKGRNISQTQHIHYHGQKVLTRTFWLGLNSRCFRVVSETRDYHWTRRRTCAWKIQQSTWICVAQQG